MRSFFFCMCASPQEKKKQNNKTNKAEQPKTVLMLCYIPKSILCSILLSFFTKLNLMSRREAKQSKLILYVFDAAPCLLAYHPISPFLSIEMLELVVIKRTG